MNTHADKTHENKSQSFSNDVIEKQNGGKSAFQFMDKRPEAIAQRKLQKIVNNSPRVRQLRSSQKMAFNDSCKSGSANTSMVIQRISYDELKNQEKPFIFNKNIKPYDDGEQFGHTFSIEIGIKDPEELFWLEKTNQPYLESMQSDSWNNMAGLVPTSKVFSDWNDVVGTPDYQIIKFVDPPSIKKTPDNHRVLEFYIHILGNDRKDMITLTARQELQTNGAGEVTKSSFSFIEEKVYKTGTAENTELSNPFWDADEGDE